VKIVPFVRGAAAAFVDEMGSRGKIGVSAFLTYRIRQQRHETERETASEKAFHRTNS
jgi:hypothetical protein